MNLERQCHVCAKPLSEVPIINVENSSFCYRCAKTVASAIEAKRHEAARLFYEAQSAAHRIAAAEFKAKRDDWERRRKACLENQFWGREAMLLTAFFSALYGSKIAGFFGFFWLGILSFVVTLVLSAQEESSRLSKFDQSNPEPKFDQKQLKYPGPLSVTISPEVRSQNEKLYRREQILKRDHFTCQWCGIRKSPEGLEVHHVVPRSNGGSDSPTNVITLCIECHDKEDWFGHIRAYKTTVSDKKKR